MFTDGHVLLCFIQFVVVDHSGRVFLTVYCTLLQSGEYFGEVHRCGDRAQSGEVFQMQCVGHGTDLQAFQVGNAFDRPLGVGDVSETNIRNRQDLNADLFFGQCAQLFTKVAVQRFMSSIQGCPQVRQAYQVPFFNETGDVCVGTPGHFNAAGTHCFNTFRNCAQLGVRIKFYGDRAVGAFFYHRYEDFFRCDVGSVAFRYVISQADGVSLAVGAAFGRAVAASCAAACCEDGEYHYSNHNPCKSFLHCFSSLFKKKQMRLSVPYSSEKVSAAPR